MITLNSVKKIVFLYFAFLLLPSEAHDAPHMHINFDSKLRAFHDCHKYYNKKITFIKKELEDEENKFVILEDKLLTETSQIKKKKIKRDINATLENLRWTAEDYRTLREKKDNACSYSNFR